jgi:hypothetical protein
MPRDLWIAEMEEPLYHKRGFVSDKVAQEEFAIFQAARKQLQPGG